MEKNKKNIDLMKLNEKNKEETKFNTDTVTDDKREKSKT